MRLIQYLISSGFLLAIVGFSVMLATLDYYGRDLPDYHQLANYQPKVMTRVHAGDGSLLAEFAEEKRLFVPIHVTPKLLIRAFLSAEDKTFYKHSGFDYRGIVRAILRNLQNVVKGKRLVGASTITQQVAKNFFLSGERSAERKIKEALLARRIEQAYTKDRILELYLNEIYLGGGSYGVAAAALNYFDKSLDELTLAEMAYLAALPKAPNNYHPVRHHKQAVQRRNWVLQRLLIDGVITAEESAFAKQELLVSRPRTQTKYVEHAGYFSEEVRRRLLAMYGEKALYNSGLSVRTTLDPAYQKIAWEVLRKGLIDYDRRHGWRGVLGRLKSFENWGEQLTRIEMPPGSEGWQMALILKTTPEQAEIGLAGGKIGLIPLSRLKWARSWMSQDDLGPKVGSTEEVFNVGDVVFVEKASDKEYELRQIPVIQGGLVALDPHTGRILAMVGGLSYEKSQFNRVTQAMRQPGSAFKPFVYMAALENGFTPASLIMDAPIVIDQGPGLPKWRPSNYSDKFYGPTTLRVGLEKSRNVMTVRLAQHIGLDKIAEQAKKFGILDNMPPHLSASLGSLETTLLRVTAGYAMFANGGKKITPTVMDRIQDRNGRNIFVHEKRPCEFCSSVRWEEQAVPKTPDIRESVADSRRAYQIVSILEGVVKRGTGSKVRPLKRPIAGKTGTTNDNRDAWFVGFSPDLAVGVYVGFDEPRTLGKNETGGRAAAPIFKDFMEQALKDKAKIPFRIPENVRLVRINSKTGRLAESGDKNVIWETFIPGTEPTHEAQAVLEGVGNGAIWQDDPLFMGNGFSQDNGPATTGTGGFY